MVQKHQNNFHLNPGKINWFDIVSCTIRDKKGITDTSLSHSTDSRWIHWHYPLFYSIYLGQQSQNTTNCAHNLLAKHHLRETQLHWLCQHSVTSRIQVIAQCQECDSKESPSCAFHVIAYTQHPYKVSNCNYKNHNYQTNSISNCFTTKNMHINCYPSLQAGNKDSAYMLSAKKCTNTQILPVLPLVATGLCWQVAARCLYWWPSGQRDRPYGATCSGTSCRQYVHSPS